MAYTDIDKPSDYFNTVLYTGNASTQTISDVNFQPNLTWIKNRNGVRYHMLFDSVRGALYRLQSNTTAVSASTANTLTSWNSDGFALGSENDTNGTGATFASWNWKAGTSFSNSAGANGATIASTGSVNQDAGFSIVSYTGNGTGNSTIGHSLGATPKFIIVKNLTTTQDWGTYSPSFVSASDPNVLYLSKTDGEADHTNVWGTSAAFNNNTFTVGDWTGSNQSGSSFIAYCFTDVQGFSKFSNYTGNGNADGTFVYTGFKPAFVMVKSTGSGGWLINDVKRSPHNITGLTLYADSSASEESYTIGASEWDFLSNGFKNRDAGSAQNTSGTSYIYMAFAENPFTTSTGVPATAR